MTFDGWFAGLLGVLVGILFGYGWWDLVKRRHYIHIGFVCDGCRQAMWERSNNGADSISRPNAKSRKEIGLDRRRSCIPMDMAVRITANNSHAPMLAVDVPIQRSAKQESHYDVVHDCKQWQSAVRNREEQRIVVNGCIRS